MKKDLETQKPPRTEDVDPDLLALAGGGSSQSVLQPILMIAIIVMGFWIIGDWRGELEYFFSSSEPIELGDVTRFAGERADDPGWSPDLPHNRYVSLGGIPTRRSQSERYRFFLLVGSDIFVEEEREDYIEDPIQRELEGEAKGDIDRTYYRGEGRIISFAEMPDRYRGIRAYYRSRYNLRFCDRLSSEEYQEILQKRRDSVIHQWRIEFKDATPEEREKKGLTLEPEKAEVERIILSEPVCIDAHLVQDGVEPKDHWWYAAVAGFFLAFMIFNFILLIRWIMRFVRS